MGKFYSEGQPISHLQNYYDYISTMLLTELETFSDRKEIMYKLDRLILEELQSVLPGEKVSDSLGDRNVLVENFRRTLIQIGISDTLAGFYSSCRVQLDDERRTTLRDPDYLAALTWYRSTFFLLVIPSRKYEARHSLLGVDSEKYIKNSDKAKPTLELDKLIFCLNREAMNVSVKNPPEIPIKIATSNLNFSRQQGVPSVKTSEPTHRLLAPSHGTV